MNTVQVQLHCTGTVTLYRYRYTKQVQLHCTCTVEYKGTYTGTGTVKYTSKVEYTYTGTGTVKISGLLLMNQKKVNVLVINN